LLQRLKTIEVIVVVDGPDDATVRALTTIVDERLSVHVRPVQGGQPAAINTGIQLARAPWIALLDDDDEWMPEKLDVQLAHATSCGLPRPIAVCRFLARSEAGDTTWPFRWPRAGEHVADYLFCRTRLAFGEGMAPTSTLFAPTEMFRHMPMDESLPKHCDLDWMIRADALLGARITLPVNPEPLAVWNMQSGRGRLSNWHDWRFSLDWIRARRSTVSSRAYAGFLLNWAAFSAWSQRDYAAFPVLLQDAVRSGRPALWDLAAYFALWLLPHRLRARLSRIAMSWGG
jgi:glycosyltransferase involved in cell wall biosynthesis